MEKNMKKNIYIYICITELLCCIVDLHIIVNQLHFNKINQKKTAAALWKSAQNGGS